MKFAKQKIRSWIELLSNIAGFQTQLDGKRSVFLKSVFKKVEHLEGDVVECGLGRLRTLSILADLIRQEKKNRKLYGFDSFLGFPEVSSIDLGEGNEKLKKGDWSVLLESHVTPLLMARGVSAEFIEKSLFVKKGFFSETLKNCEIKKICFLHLDVDLHDSYKTCLNELFPKIVTGGVIAFDEYDSPSDLKKWPGAKIAIDEFLKNKKIKIKKEIFSKKAFCVKE